MSLAKLPTEILDVVFESLSASHSCATCASTDFRSTALVCRSLNASATRHLYRSICLRGHNPNNYEARIHSLTTTLSKKPELGGLVRRLRFCAENTEVTGRLWSEVAKLTPGLNALQGVETFFDGEDGRMGVLKGLRGMRQAVLHQEVIPGRLSTVLDSWPELETLVLGNVVADNDCEEEDAECTYEDLSMALGQMKRLRNVYFHDCDLDYDTADGRAGFLGRLQPFQRLGIEYSLSDAFSLKNIASTFLGASRVHAEMLHTLDFHRQLKRQNSLADLETLLGAAKALRKLSIQLTWFPGDEPELGTSVVLRSNTLEELRWIVSYMKFKGSEGSGGEEECVEVLGRSLKMKALPALRELTVGAGCEALGELEQATMDVEKSGARVLVMVEEAEEAVKAGADCERVSGLKRGGNRRCEGGKEADGDDEAGGDGAVQALAKEDMWGQQAGDLLGLWW